MNKDLQKKIQEPITQEETTMNKQQLFETMIEVEQLTGSTEVQDQILSSVRLEGIGVITIALTLGCLAGVLFYKSKQEKALQLAALLFLSAALFFSIDGSRTIARTYYAPKVVILEHFTE